MDIQKRCKADSRNSRFCAIVYRFIKILKKILCGKDTDLKQNLLRITDL